MVTIIILVLILIFVAGNILFNIAYSAPDKSLLEKYRSTVESSLSTLEITDKVKISDEQREKHIVARHLRIAHLLSKNLDSEGAISSINDGLDIYPENELEGVQIEEK